MLNIALLTYLLYFSLCVLYSQLIALTILLYIIHANAGARIPRTRRFKRHVRNSKRFEELWNGDEERFVEAFRMSKATFTYILENIEGEIRKKDIVGDTIPPNKRLAVTLARLVRGEYFYSIGESFGIGETTAQQIHNETIRVIVNKLFKRHVTDLLPSTADELETLQRQMDFPFAWAAIDGCHIRLQCPVGEHSRKDYYNFKGFYSIILLALVDAKCRFLWAASGMPGNCHDSTLLQSTSLWPLLHNMSRQKISMINGMEIPSFILGDNAFPFRSFLMKRFTQSQKTAQQRKFNKALSSSRVVVEDSFGYLKMRFRELFRGSESSPENLKYSVLAAVTLHNLLTDRHGLPVGGPDKEGIVHLEPHIARENNGLASRIRDALVPLVQ